MPQTAVPQRSILGISLEAAPCPSVRVGSLHPGWEPIQNSTPGASDETRSVGRAGRLPLPVLLAALRRLEAELLECRAEELEGG